MELTFLGTGTSQGVPIITCDCKVCRSTDPRDNRLRTSALINYKDKNIVIDTGPDFRFQMLRSKTQSLDAVLFTHQHKDHIGGLDDVRPFNFKQKKPMNVYGDARVIRALKREFSYAFALEKYPGVPSIELNTIDDKPFMIDDIEIIPIEAMHFQLPVLGFRIGQMAYITDASYISEEELAKLSGIKTLVINALRKEKHYSHFNLHEALSYIKKINPQYSYLTHISHQLGLHSQVSKELPPNVFPAYDGLHLKI